MGPRDHIFWFEASNFHSPLFCPYLKHSQRGGETTPAPQFFSSLHLLFTEAKQTPTITPQ
jgi:hypothetical protein